MKYLDPLFSAIPHLCDMSSQLPSIILDHKDFVIANKPSGMLTIPDRQQEVTITLRSWLEAKYDRVWTVHRLDKDTSGAIVFAKNEKAHQYLSQLFESREVYKCYLGIVHGEPMPSNGRINQPIASHSSNDGTMIVHKRGKESLTDYGVVETFRGLSLVKFVLHTGRTHQIRVHSKYIGHPIVCDPVYGDGKPVLLSSFKKKYHTGKFSDEEKPLLNRLGLHAFQLRFQHADGNVIEAEAPLHKDMRALLSQLRKTYL